jgi:hypothetical protein
MLNCELVVVPELINGESNNVSWLFELLKSFIVIDCCSFSFCIEFVVVRTMVDIVLDKVVATLVNVYLL